MPRGFLVKRHSAHPLSTSVHPLSIRERTELPLPLIKRYRSYSDEDRSDSSASEHEVPLKLKLAQPTQPVYRGAADLYSLAVAAEASVS